MDNGEFYELPFEPGRSFRVLQGYGGSHSHTGDSHFSIDFAMPEGTPICASRSGVAYRVIDHFREGGSHRSFKPKANTIHILHADDSVAAYVHLSYRGSCVRAGDPVTVGQVIGYSGNTGWSTSPHLHFHVADAISRRRTPTHFRTAELGITTIETDSWYTRPKCSGERTLPSRRQPDDMPVIQNHDPFAFSPKLLSLTQDLKGDLASAGYEEGADYSSVDAMHDVHGLEVCGIRNSETALEVTRLLLRLFPGWNAGWLHAPEYSSAQDWVATIQRDRDPVLEYWDTD